MVDELIEDISSMSVTRFMINEAEQLFSTTAACLRIACDSTPLKLVALGLDCAGKSLGSFVNVKFGEKGNAGDGLFLDCRRSCSGIPRVIRFKHPF